MEELWTIKRVLDWIEGYLRGKGDENPRLSAQWLVSEVLGIRRIELYLDPERPLTAQERAILKEYTLRRGAKEPLQYITGTVGFRFLTLQVRPGVLIPRPETEVLVSEALSRLNAEGRLTKEPDESSRLLVADLCTGSGCIACSIATEIPYAEVVATDIDPNAVELARANAERLGLLQRVQVLECDMGDGIDEGLMKTFDLVIANPPYIPTDLMATLDKEVADFEPDLALDGGTDGLDAFRRILPFAARALAHKGVLAVELHEDSLDEAAQKTKEAGFHNIRVTNDLAGRKRVLTAQKG